MMFVTSSPVSEQHQHGQRLRRGPECGRRAAPRAAAARGSSSSGSIHELQDEAHRPSTVATIGSQTSSPAIR